MIRTLLDKAISDHNHGRYDRAELRYRAVLAERPTDTDALHLLATLLWSRDKSSKEALHLISQALESRPDNPLVLHNYASMLTTSGRFDEAINNYKQAIALKPDYAEAYFNLSGFTTFRPGDPLVEQMKRLAETPGLAAKDRAHVGFACAKAYRDLGQHEAAFEAAVGANILIERPFDKSAHMAQIDEIISVYQPDLFASLAGVGDESDAPIFIVGMPRSGTTLCERIIAAHPQVYGAGELTMIGSINAQMQSHPNLNAIVAAEGTVARHIPHLPTTEFAAAAHSCLKMIAQRAGSSPLRFTDKMPFNFLHLGLIALMFPNARIIHVRRHPLDIATSCFFQHFQNGHNFSYTLEGLGSFILQQQRLMAHWAKVAPLAMHTVDYEALVLAPERESRRLVAFCGLDWHRACLSPERSDQTIATASRWQARQAINTSSVGRWTLYRDQLAPVISALEDRSII